MKLETNQEHKLDAMIKMLRYSRELHVNAIAELTDKISILKAQKEWMK